MRARFDEHKSAHKVCGRGQQAKEKKSDKSPGIKIHCLVLTELVSFKTGASIYNKPSPADMNTSLGADVANVVGRQQANSNFAAGRQNTQKLKFFGDFGIDSQNEGA